MIRRPPISTRTVFPDTTLFRSESIYRDDFPTSRAERSEEYSMKMNDMMISSVDDHISEPPGMFDKHLSGDDLATAPKFCVADNGTSYWESQGKTGSGSCRAGVCQCV